MAKIIVTLEFASEAEAASFFLQHATVGHPVLRVNAAVGAATPTAPERIIITPASAVSASPVTTPIPTSAPAAPAATVTPATVTAGATAEDPFKATHAAMTAMIGRLDAKGVTGAGAVQAKAILNAHGLTRTRDVKPEQAPALIAAFNAVV